MSFLNLLQKDLAASNDNTLSTTTTNHLIVSIGSTPSLSHHFRGDDASSVLENVVELHPGNYTLYDRQQLWTGACHDQSLVAGRVLTTVIGHYEDRNMIMLDAGATALTKDTYISSGWHVRIDRISRIRMPSHESRGYLGPTQGSQRYLSL
jgi:D-serine deaminase-like pyridoxal phosphate-dependent protein